MGSRQFERRSSLPYFGFLPVGFALVVAVLFFGSRSVAANTLVATLGLFVMAEGILLVTDWRGCAREFSARLKETPGSVLTHFDPWFIRGVLGIGFGVMGVIVLADAIRYF
jgi:hypothetical protein